MKIGIMTINGFEFHPNHRLRKAAVDKGHEIILINPYTLVASLRGHAFDFFADGKVEKPDLILPRQGSPMGDYGLALLRHFVQMKIILVNGVEGVTIARNQYLTLQALAASRIPVPASCFITEKTGFLRAVDFLGGYPIVLKQVDGMGGDGVIRVDGFEEAQLFLDRQLTSRKGVVAQEFIPPKGRRDIRLLVVGTRVVGAMELTPLNNDFRANIHQNGRAEAIEPQAPWAQMALDSAKACRLEIAGVDMIVERGGAPKIVEVNYSPGFRGLEAATELDIARKIIEYISLKYQQNTAGGQKA
jgi:ribosomal protein S6--L-glutamate ligase